MASAKEQEIINYGRQNGKGDREILEALTKYRLANLSVSDSGVRELTPIRQHGLREMGGDIIETGKGIINEFHEAGKKIVKVATDNNLSFVEKGLGIGAEAFRGGVRAVVEQPVLGAGKALLSQRKEEQIAGAVEGFAENIAQAPEVQNLVKWYQELPEDKQRAVNNIAGFGEFLTTVGTGGLAKPVTKAAFNAFEKTTAETGKVLNKAFSEAFGKVGTLAQRLNPLSLRVFERGLPATTQKEAVKIRTDTFETAIIQDDVTILNALDEQAKEATRFSRATGGEEVTPRQLLGRVAEAGYTPEVAREGKSVVGRFDVAFKDIEAKQAVQLKKIKKTAASITEKTQLSVLEESAIASLNKTVIGGIREMEGRVRSFFKDVEKTYKLTDLDASQKLLTAEQINAIRVDFNGISRAFKGEKFKQDAANTVANAMRARLDEFGPEIRAANAEFGRLEDLRKTVDLLHNKPINVGILGDSAGRYVGALSAGIVGGVIATGSGALVIAGLFAALGGLGFSRFLRNRRFSDKITQTIINEIRKSPETVDELIKDTTGSDRQLLERLLRGTEDVTAFEAAGGAGATFGSLVDELEEESEK